MINAMVSSGYSLWRKNSSIRVKTATPAQDIERCRDDR